MKVHMLVPTLLQLLGQQGEHSHKMHEPDEISSIYAWVVMISIGKEFKNRWLALG